MTGLMARAMQDWPLTVDRIILHAERSHADVAVMSRRADGTLNHSSYGAVAEAARGVSRALASAGIGRGDTVATLAWNSERHLALWYGISGMGAICHPLNPRFSIDQLAYVVAHARDRILFVDAAFMPLVLSMAHHLRRLERVVVLEAYGGETGGLPVVSLDAFVTGAANVPTPQWGDFAETTPCALFYTSGTTGNPKGVIYTHRSNVFHAMALGLGYGFSIVDTIMPIVPMFHANGWGLPYLAPVLGVPLAMPGSEMDPASLYATMEDCKVTAAAGVPTIWTGLLQHLRATGETISTAKRLYSAGSATSPALMRAYSREQGVRIIPSWGMTELSPSGTVGAGLKPHDRDDDPRQGRFVFGVEGVVSDDARHPVEHDGTTIGALRVRGAAAVLRYAEAQEDAVDDDGWFDTGDLAVVHPDGAIEVVDRAKDVIKSGGEWISSTALERAAAEHPAIEMCAAIGVPDPKWDERPLLLIKASGDPAMIVDEVRTLLHATLPRWWVPERIECVHGFPFGSTGKVDKKLLRAHYADHIATSLAGALPG